MRLIDLIWTAVQCYPQDSRVEVHDLDGNIYRTLNCGMMTKTHPIRLEDGAILERSEEVFVVRVQLVEKAGREQ